MQQLDLTEGQHLRDIGIEKVAGHNTTWIETARLTAEGICRRHGQVTSDDLREVMAGNEPDHPNAWGAVFSRCKRFKKIGYTQSRMPSRHAAVIAIWALK